MKITTRQLKQLIKEEVSKLLNEGSFEDKAREFVSTLTPYDLSSGEGNMGEWSWKGGMLKHKKSGKTISFDKVFKLGPPQGGASYPQDDDFATYLGSADPADDLNF